MKKFSKKQISKKQWMTAGIAAVIFVSAAGGAFAVWKPRNTETERRLSEAVSEIENINSRDNVVDANTAFEGEPVETRKEAGKRKNQENTVDGEISGKHKKSEKTENPEKQEKPNEQGNEDNHGGIENSGGQGESGNGGNSGSEDQNGIPDKEDKPDDENNPGNEDNHENKPEDTDKPGSTAPVIPEPGWTAGIY